MRRPLLDVRDDDEGQQTTGGTPRTVKMAQERDDLVYLAKLAEQADAADAAETSAPADSQVGDV